MNYLLSTYTAGQITLACVLLAVGIVLIIKGGDFFVDSSVWVAEILHMPKFLIGATIVSLATTLPELLVSIFAVVEGSYDISIGNAVGSVTANTGLILAISAIFVGGAINRKEFGIKAIILVISSTVLFAFSLSGSFGIIPSVLLMLVFIYYTYETIVSAKRNMSDQKEITKTEVQEKPSKKVVFINIMKFIFGAIGIVVGARLLIDNSIIVATSLGISEGIIAITIVAIGTSLPELITTITSIVKKQGELGVGNIIGANIIDLVMILPICSFICAGKLIITDQGRYLDMPAMLIITLVAVIPPIFTKKFTKIQGFIMLALYITYLVLAATFFGK